jgi:hypothetical protein
LPQFPRGASRECGEANRIAFGAGTFTSTTGVLALAPKYPARYGSDCGQVSRGRSAN